MPVVDFFASHPVFSRDEFVQFLKQRGAPSVETANVHLKRYLASGRIARVKRGVYVAAGPGETAHRGALDFPLVASRLVPDAVLAYHTALEVHGYAQSLFERLFFLTASKAKPLTFRHRRFVPVAPPKPLRGQSQYFSHTTEVERRGLSCRVTTLERTVVDVLGRPDLAGGLEEVWRSLAGIPLLDLGAVLEYVRLRGLATLAGRVGLFLEQRKGALAVPAHVLDALRAIRPKQVQYLDRRHRGRLAPGWNLIVPEALLSRDWEAIR